MKYSSKNKRSPLRAYGIGALMLVLAVLSGLLLGSSRLNPLTWLTALLEGNTADPSLRILLYVRLPRVWASLLCGAALAVSGAVIQTVLNNRLASPGIIGVNAGAGLAVTVCAALDLVGGWQVSALAFAGAFLAVMLVALGAGKWNASRGTVILMGVALNSLLGAFSDTIRVINPDVSIMTGDFRMGDFFSVTYSSLIPAAVVVPLVGLLLLTLSTHMDVLSLGEDAAKGLGMETKGVRILLLLLAAVLAGAAVSVCGLLSFVGLLVPHGVRRAVGMSASRSRHLIPLCAIFGGGFVTLCDTLSRVIFAPYEIPVGVIMAFLGAPFFVFILIKGKEGEHHA